MSSVQKVRLLRCLSRFVPTNTNSSDREIPVTISGLVMGMLVRLITVFRSRGFRPLMPTAATVPKTVEMVLASTEIRMELPSMDSRDRSRNTSTYCIRVKDSNWVISLPVLKDAVISTAIGA